MKILAISGSPRKNGNTVVMLRHALDVLEKRGMETELISLAGLEIRPCTACLGCRRGEVRCVQQDDFDPVFRAMVDADGLIVGSPVYFGSATPETMALLDRAGYVSRGNGNLFARKVGGPIAVARRIGQNFTFAQLLMWFMINGMVVPGSTYWGIGFGKKEGEVASDAEGMDTVAAFAENVGWLLEKTRG